jgi:feruloyl esterase
MRFPLYLAAASALLLADPNCESLAQAKLNRASIASAAAAGDVCVVRVVARPTKDSEINLEVRLPDPAKWNGRYQQFGNGGWAGAINTATLKAASAKGYAAAATDDGHASGAGDAAWAVGHPEKLIDFGHRAVHVTSVHAKALIAAYYGKSASRHYFLGCSDGGREALMEAQRYPEDFDGILAGAPASDWSHLFTGFIWNEQALMKDPASFIPAAKLPAIQKAVVASCDSTDGVKDGLIEDPRRCAFEPKTLLCGTADTNDCLTRPQVEALTRIYAGPKNPRTGKQIYPGFPPGTEAINGGWAPWIIGNPPERSLQFAFGNSYYGQAVFEDPNWNFRSLEFDADVDYGDRKAGIHLNSNNPDLRSFRAHGGRLIQYHGWGDAAIPATGSIEYYEAVNEFFRRYPDGRAAAVTGKVADFYRLFLVPGMGHCAGGLGANRFGQGDNAPADPERNIVAALEQWVEKGVAPEKMIATGADKGFSRPLCPYPQQARYNGSGNPNDASSFVCAAPAR